MSLINQVLDQLERRGAHAVLKQNMVRVVPQSTRRAIPLVLMLAGVFLLAVAGVRLASQLHAASPNSQNAQPDTRVVSGSIVTPVLADMTEVANQSGIPATEPVSGVVAAEPQSLDAALPPSFELSLQVSAPEEPRKMVRATKPVGAATVKEATKEPVAQVTKPKPSAEAAQSVVIGGRPPMKQVSQAQQADAEFRKGVALMQQGRQLEAISNYQAALHLDVNHDMARQALAVLLLEQKRGAEAEQLLQDRLKQKPEHIGFAMTLARLQVERGVVGEALVTLESSLPYADANADYGAFYAALLQRVGRHEEAVAHYQTALQLKPNHSTWLMGCGISLQALQRKDEAKKVYQRALDAKTLSPELQAYVQQRIKGL